MGDLSEHFSSWEFACQGEDCCGGSAPVDLRLIEGLEELRRRVYRPLEIVRRDGSGGSGFRCRKHNRAIGSEDSSQHCLGRAADVQTPDVVESWELATLAEVVFSFTKGGIGIYDWGIHVDVRLDGPARWDRRWE